MGGLWGEGFETERTASTEALRRKSKGQIKARWWGWRGTRRRWGRARLSEEEGPGSFITRGLQGGCGQGGT